MKLIKLMKNVYQIDFSSRSELLKTFIRFQEYYESPEFKSKVFTVRQYAKWYRSFYKKEKFTYYSDWSGCNVPSHVFDFFRQGKMGSLSKREKALLKLLPKSGNFYVIGTFDGGKNDVLEHEKAHGLFYSNPKYKNSVMKVLNKYKPELGGVYRFVKKLGYHDSVSDDEVQAYVGTTIEKLKEKKVKFPLSCHLELNKIYKLHLK